MMDVPVDGARVLVMFSGGLDSAALLKLMLTETQNKIWVHHISMRTKPHRWEAEDPAAFKCLRYFSNYYRPFTFSESVIDIEKDVSGWRDIELIAFLGSLYARENKAGFVVSGQKKADPTNSSLPDEWLARRKFESDMLKLFYPSACWVYPIVEWSKQKIADYLEPELRQLTWSCRIPVKKNDTWIPCGHCFACVAKKEME